MTRSVGAPLAGALLLAALAPGVPSRAAPMGEVPLKETLTLVDFGPLGEAYYVGTGTHLGRLTAVEYFNPDFDPTDPDSVFATYVKTAANGDTVVGTIIPDDPTNPFTTGGFTVDGGTGRFRGATGRGRYVVSFNPDTGYTIEIDGTMSSVGSGK